MNTGKCSSCGADIIWAKTVQGKNIPIDSQPAQNGNLVFVSPSTVMYTEKGAIAHTDHYISHFATCPNAAKHRKPK